MVFSSINPISLSVRQPWPIIRTNNIMDFRKIPELTSEYVWLLNDRYDFKDNFPLGWLPCDLERDNIHLFPMRSETSQEVLEYVAALVPVKLSGRKWPIKQKISACVKNVSYDIFLIGGIDENSISKYKEKRTLFKNTYLVDKTLSPAMRNKQILKHANSDFVWVIPLENSLPTYVNAVKPHDGNAVYDYGFGKLYPVSFLIDDESSYYEVNCQSDQ